MPSIKSSDYLSAMIAALPAHYSRDILWQVKGTSVAADRRTVLTPDSISINVGVRGFFLGAQQELDLNDADNWDSASPDYTVAANRAGKNFYVYAVWGSGKSLGLKLSANSTVPSGYTADNSRKVGGFSCLALAVDHATTLTGWTADTAVALGQTLRASTWDGYLYRCVARAGTFKTHATTEPNWAAVAVDGTVVDNEITWIKEVHRLESFLAGDILPASVWDLLHRPRCSPEGMVYSDELHLWVDIWRQTGSGATTAATYGGTITRSRTWASLVDDQGQVGKRLLRDHEFQLACTGSNEMADRTGAIAATNTPGATAGGRRCVSHMGCEDMTGAGLYHWLLDSTFALQGADLDACKAFAWGTSTNYYGQNYGQGTLAGDTKLLAGRQEADKGGSRQRMFGGGGSISRYTQSSYVTTRGCCEPL